MNKIEIMDKVVFTVENHNIELDKDIYDQHSAKVVPEDEMIEGYVFMLEKEGITDDKAIAKAIEDSMLEELGDDYIKKEPLDQLIEEIPKEPVESENFSKDLEKINKWLDNL